MPDSQLYGAYEYNMDYVETMVKNYSYLKRGLSLVLNGVEYKSENGLLDLVNERLTEDPVYPPIHLEGNDIEIVLTHGNSYGENVASFVNGQNTRDGGTHLAAYREAVAKTLKDFFKKINDTWGHSVGDEVLVNLSKLIRSRIRTTDALVRWGGEEFVILCSDTPLQNAQFLAEKLRVNVENTQLISQQQITCSFGVAEMLPHEDPKIVFEHLDKALYSSKRGGRNSVTAAIKKI